MRSRIHSFSERPLWPGSLGTKFPSSGAKGKSIHPETKRGNLFFFTYSIGMIELTMYAEMCFKCKSIHPETKRGNSISMIELRMYAEMCFKGKSIYPETNGGNISFHLIHWEWLCLECM